MSEQQIDKQRVVFAILKFLDDEIKSETENAERRESMEGRSFIIILKHVFIQVFRFLLSCYSMP